MILVKNLLDMDCRIYYYHMIIYSIIIQRFWRKKYYNYKNINFYKKYRMRLNGYSKEIIHPKIIKPSFKYGYKIGY